MGNDAERAIMEFFEAEDRNRKAADANVNPEQSALKPGDFFVRHAYGITIYGEIIDPVTLSLNGRRIEDLTEEEQEEIRDIRELYNDETMKNYRFTRSYSSVCPDGELGDIHISTVSRTISREEFLSAQKKGWA